MRAGEELSLPAGSGHDERAEKTKTGGWFRSTEGAIVAPKRSWRQIFLCKPGARHRARKNRGGAIVHRGGWRRRCRLRGGGGGGAGAGWEPHGAGGGEGAARQRGPQQPSSLPRGGGE